MIQKKIRLFFSEKNLLILFIMLLKFSIVFFILYLVFVSIVHSISSNTCTKIETKPVRYDYGFLGFKKIIITTEGNHDGYEKVCVEKGNNISFFDVQGHLDFILDFYGGKYEK